MTAVPVEVHVTVGTRVGSVVVVGDPDDALFAMQVGRAVSAFILEHDPKIHLAAEL